VVVKRGSDGTHLWEESITGYSAYIDAEVVADLDGDGLPDVLVNSEVGPWDDRTDAVIAKRGSDGTHLWEESITGYDADMDAEVVAADFNGDGLPDVLVESYVGPWENPTYTLIGKKGNDGTHLWEARSNEEMELPRLGEDDDDDDDDDEDGEPLFYDLDGDGKADALLWITNKVCAVSVGQEAPVLPSAVPTVSQWGIIAMSAMFAAFLIWAVGKGRLSGARKPGR